MKPKNPPVPAELSIGLLAKQSSVAPATINYYVTQGVLPPPRKLNRTRAAYSQRHLRALELIKRMQAQGYTLALIRGAFERFGSDEAGLRKLEGIGSLRDLPAPKTAPHLKPIAPFEPVDRATFLEMADCSSELLERLLKRGVLRPLARGRFDSRDLYLVRMVQVLQRDGISLGATDGLGELLTAAKRLEPLVLKRAVAHLPAIRARELRFTDLFEPWEAALGYLVDRIATERDPNWRTAYFVK